MLKPSRAMNVLVVHWVRIASRMLGDAAASWWDPAFRVDFIGREFRVTWAEFMDALDVMYFIK